MKGGCENDIEWKCGGGGENCIIFNFAHSTCYSDLVVLYFPEEKKTAGWIVLLNAAGKEMYSSEFIQSRWNFE